MAGIGGHRARAQRQVHHRDIEEIYVVGEEDEGAFRGHFAHLFVIDLAGQLNQEMDNAGKEAVEEVAGV